MNKNVTGCMKSIMFVSTCYYIYSSYIKKNNKTDKSTQTDNVTSDHNEQTNLHMDSEDFSQQFNLEEGEEYININKKNITYFEPMASISKYLTGN
jgi:hypothetical protein